jgi:hypothetical protein
MSVWFAQETVARLPPSNLPAFKAAPDHKGVAAFKRLRLPAVCVAKRLHSGNLV